MSGFRFADPWFLTALVLPLALLIRTPRRGGTAFGAFGLATLALRPSPGPFLSRCLIALALSCLVLAMARPQFGKSVEIRERHGRDLMLVIDLSFSMITDDMADSDGRRTTRLRTVFNAAQEFIAKRSDDRIGLVFFSEQATTSCPLTFDHGTITDFLLQTRERQEQIWDDSLRSTSPQGMLGTGTNLGLGIGTALKRLSQDNPKGRAVVLITDGRDSREMANWIDPLEAARNAEQLGVIVHAIGVGDPKGRMTSIQGMMRGWRELVPIPRDFLPDMGRLKDIVRLAKGETRHVDDGTRFQEVLDAIQGLEPRPSEVTLRHDYSDRFFVPLLAGFLLLVLAFVVEPRLRGVA